MTVSADEMGVVNGEFIGDRESQTSSTDLSEMTSVTLASEVDDKEGCLTEDEEPDTPVKPSLR